MYMYLPYQISVARLRERLEDLGVLDYLWKTKVLYIDMGLCGNT